MRIKEGFVLRNVCGENVIIAEGLKTIDFSRLLSLNETAAWLWKKALELGDFSAAQLVEAVCQEFEVSEADAAADVENLLKQWNELGMTE